MINKKKKIALLNRTFAIFLIVIGFFGIILPILPGWPFIFIGLFLLGGTELIDKKILKYLPQKYRTAISRWITKITKENKSD